MRLGRLAATSVAVVAEFVLLAVVGSINGSPVVVSSLVWLLGFAVMALVGALILQHAPGNRVGQAFLLAGLGTPLASLLGEVAIATGMAGVHVVSLMAFGSAWVVATTVPLLYFPDGRLPSLRWRWAPRLVVVTVVVLCVSTLVSPVPLDGGDVVSPWAVEALGSVPITVANGCLIVSAGITLAGAVSLVLRWRRADGPTRSRLSWLALGALVVVVVTVSVWAFPDVPDTAGALAETAQVVVLPVATCIAITRHRLFDIDLVLRRSLVYTTLAALVVLAYVLSLLATTRLVGDAAGYGASLVCGAVVAVVLMPVRDRLERRVDRWLYGHRDPDIVMAGVRNGDADQHPADVLDAAAGSIRQALRVEHVRIEPDTEQPAEQEPETRVPLVALGRTEGVLVVGPRDDGSKLTRRDLRVLDGLAGQVALLARAVRLAEDVQSSRERLVAAQEAERLRLRRDLHDGLGPILAGLTLQVDALGDKVADADGALLADRIKHEMQGAIGALRSAVDGLRPADLDQLGLAESLAQRAALLSGDGIAVTVECPVRLRLAPAAEVAAYRVATEGMTNALRHADATSCTVRVAQDGETVVVTVVDDGSGIPTANGGRAGGAGVGLESIRERTEELGGSWRIDSRPGCGTTLEVRLPMGVRQ